MNTVKLRLLATVIMIAILASFVQISVFAEVININTPGNSTVEGNVSSTDILSGKKLDTKDIPLHINTKDIEEKGHVERLRSEEKDLYSAVFQNSDGTQTVYFFGTPIKYIDDDGSIKDISTQIINSANVKNNKSYQYAVSGNRFKHYYSNNSDVGVLLEVDDYSIQMIPVGINRMTINNASVINNTVCYTNVFGSDSMVRYTPTSTGIKEDIILESCPKSNSFSFMIYTDGLKLQSINDKLYLLDNDSIIVADLGEVIIYDSNGLYGSGTMSFAQIKDKYAYTVTITVDESYLRSQRTCYPVIVDPTLTIHQTDIIGEDEEYGDAVEGNAIEDLCVYWGGESPISTDSTKPYLTDIGNYHYEEYYEEDEEGDQFWTTNNSVSHMLYRIVEGYWDWNPLSGYLSDDQCESVTLHVNGSVSGSGVTVIAYPYGYTWTNGISSKVSPYMLNIGSSNVSTTYISESGELEIDITNVAKFWSTADSATRNKGLALAIQGEGDDTDSELSKRLSIYQTENTNYSNDVYITVTYWGEYNVDFSPGLYRISTSYMNSNNEVVTKYLSSQFKVLQNSRPHVADYIDSLDDKSASQMWGIEKVGAYSYRIISTWFKTSDYEDEIVVAVGTDGYLCFEEYNGNSNQLWEIFTLDSEYRLINKSNTSQMVNIPKFNGGWVSVSANVCNLHIDYVDDLPSVIFDRYNETYSVGIGTYGALNIKINIDSSAIYGNITQELIVAGVQSWESVSNKINIYVPGETAPNNCLEITVVGSEYNGTALGEFKPTGTDALITGGTIHLYLNNISNSSTFDIQATVAHEMGHALLLDHYAETKNGYGDDIDPTIHISNDTILSVMNSGKATEISHKTITPSILDRWMIYLKWGI